MSDTDIYQIIKDNKQFRFQLELSLTTDEERKKQLQTIINNLNQVIVFDKDNNLGKTMHQQLNNDIDKEVYSQPWNKLKECQKEVKIREYVDNTYSDHEKNDMLQTFLEELKKSKLKNTVKHNRVDYDSTNSKIIKIEL